jgi:hypothetical protein
MTLVTSLEQIYVVVICYSVLCINNFLLLLLLLNAIGFSLRGCNPCTNTDTTIKNIHKGNNTKHSANKKTQ